MALNIVRGFWKLTWVETKVFVREPMGFVGTLIMPAVVFVALGRLLGTPAPVGAPVGVSVGAAAPEAAGLPFNLAILAALTHQFWVIGLE